MVLGGVAKIAGEAGGTAKTAAKTAGAEGIAKGLVGDLISGLDSTLKMVLIPVSEPLALISKMVGTFISGFETSFTPLLKSVNALGKVLGAVAMPFLNLFIPYFTLFARMTLPLIRIMNQLLKPVMENMMKWSKENPTLASNPVFYAAKLALELGGVFNQLFDLVKISLIQAIGETIATLADMIGLDGDKIRDIFGRMSTSIGDTGDAVTESTTSLDIFGTTVTSFGTTVDSVSSFIGGIIDGLKQKTTPISADAGKETEWMDIPAYEGPLPGLSGMKIPGLESGEPDLDIPVDWQKVWDTTIENAKIDYTKLDFSSPVSTAIESSASNIILSDAAASRVIETIYGNLMNDPGWKKVRGESGFGDLSGQEISDMTKQNPYVMDVDADYAQAWIDQNTQVVATTGALKQVEDVLVTHSLVPDLQMMDDAILNNAYPAMTNLASKMDGVGSEFSTWKSKMASFDPVSYMKKQIEKEVSKMSGGSSDDGRKGYYQSGY